MCICGCKFFGAVGHAVHRFRISCCTSLRFAFSPLFPRCFAREGTSSRLMIGVPWLMIICISLTLTGRHLHDRARLSLPVFPLNPPPVQGCRRV